MNSELSRRTWFTSGKAKLKKYNKKMQSFSVCQTDRELSFISHLRRRRRRRIFGDYLATVPVSEIRRLPPTHADDHTEYDTNKRQKTNRRNRCMPIVANSVAPHFQL